MVKTKANGTAAAAQATRIQRLEETTVSLALPASATLLTPSGVRGATPAELAGFRRWLYAQAIALDDPQLVKRFKARYPTPEAFDSAGFKRFLRYSPRPRRRMWTIDRARSGASLDARGMLSASATAPDRDGRYRDRLLFDPETGQASRDSHDRLVPVDPAILNIGRAHGAESQLGDELCAPTPELTSWTSSDELAQNPSQFASPLGGVAGAVPMNGADRAQQLTDLALLAAQWENAASRYATVTFAGQAMWHLLRAAAPLRTAQVADPAVVDRAHQLYWWRAFLTSGGYLAPLYSRGQTVLRIAENMRRFVDLRMREQYEMAKQDGQAVEPIAAALASLNSDGDHTLNVEAKDPTAFAQALARAVAREASQELQGLAAAVRRLACGRLFADGYRVPHVRAKERPAFSELVCHDDAAAQTTIDTAIGRTMSRGAAAVRRYDAALAPALLAARKDFRPVLTRFVTSALDALDAEDARRTAWQEAPASGTRDTIRVSVWPIVQGTILALLTLWFWWVIRRPLPPMERRPAPTDGTESAA